MVLKSIPAAIITWLSLVTITLVLAIPELQQWLTVAVFLTIIKALLVSEQFMGLKDAYRGWRYTIALYAIMMPFSCFLLITL